MDKQKINPRAETIELKADSDKEFFLIHGYTGSPGDFNGLGHRLNEKFNANVKIIRLLGHGESIESLDNISYNNFIDQIEKELKNDLNKKRKIILGGYSFGGLAALTLAAKYPVLGVFSVGAAYKLNFPFNIKGLGLLGIIKKYWKKRLQEDEIEDRKESFHYSHMHSNGLKIIKKAKIHLNNSIKKINCPVLIIHSKSERLANYKSAEIIYEKIFGKNKQMTIFDQNRHNLFFSLLKDKVAEEIICFVDDNAVFEKKEEDVAAIVPAYNEEERIEKVLKVLAMCPIIKEIVVVDDGSKDKTEEIVKKFKRVKYLKNEKNMGKAASMDRGVKSTKCQIIFFCDADLEGLTPEIVKEIIEPVREGRSDMFVGIRNNFTQKNLPYGLNSGERALRREIWEKLPDYYKHRYRIEAGLNYFVRRCYRGVDSKIFPYYQMFKESKYGFRKGFGLRIWMYWDVLQGYLRAWTISYITKFKS